MSNLFTVTIPPAGSVPPTQKFQLTRPAQMRLTVTPTRALVWDAIEAETSSILIQNDTEGELRVTTHIAGNTWYDHTPSILKKESMEIPLEGETNVALLFRSFTVAPPTA